MLSWVAVGLVATNLVAFVVYGLDKAQARAFGPRVSEATLLWLALVGGVGAWIGCEVFRHKTRKQPFRSWLSLVVAAHLAFATALIAFLPM